MGRDTKLDVCTRDQACFRLFLCVWYRQHRNSYLKKSTINTKEWGKSRFDGILELWIFDHLYFGRFVAPAFCLIPRVRCFCFGAIMLDKETRRKDYWFLFFICLLVWFLYTAKCEFSSKLRAYIKDWSPSRGSGGSICSRNIRLSTLGDWTTYVQ